MYKTIEEKLSAIKAINSEIDVVTNKITQVIRMTNDIKDVSIQLNTLKSGSITVEVDDDTKTQLLSDFQFELECRLTELKSNAEQLMK